MRNLINFLIKNISWFIFIIFEIICFYFILNHNAFQRSVFFNSSNSAIGNIYGKAADISSYFGLRQENKSLLDENEQMRFQIKKLEHYLEQIENDSLRTKAFLQTISKKKMGKAFVLASVVNNSIIPNSNNFITIDKGRKQGIKEDLGVVSQNGVVGIVRAVSDNYAVVQSLLNSNTRFSCKVLKSNTAGILVWDGENSRYATLTDYPKYEQIHKGDTIVTSGFSGIFPENVLVGTLDNYKSEMNDNFNDLRIKLFTNFGSLKNVFVMLNVNQEKINLEKSIYKKKNDKR